METWNLKAIRASLKMSQAEFSKAIGMPVTTYQRREAKPYNLTLEEAKKISELSGIDINDIDISKD